MSVFYNVYNITFLFLNSNKIDKSIEKADIFSNKFDISLQSIKAKIYISKTSFYIIFSSISNSIIHK